MAARIEWNRQAFEQIRREPVVSTELLKEAEKIAQRAGDGYVAVRGRGRTRNRAAVVTSNAEAIRDNAENNTLIRALGGGA
ncbi:hypothetical protein IU440_28935 [Nocardia cyriacigeorgica]|uniref:hypothetical protein n=1 Tax=Nocardia cyriacigeorgica TaxID=135487 RepID=UPI00189516BF|nr:hypothetical protein [Nocardia cyriacigeorgica]MBF6428703.1 hypothetical protein [Nocardia cyriacigeorgica]